MKALAPKSAAGILFCACLVFSFSADAFDLNGTWTTDDSNCNRVFVKKQNFADQERRRFWWRLYR
jgi:hypothetical protein